MVIEDRVRGRKLVHEAEVQTGRHFMWNSPGSCPLRNEASNLGQATVRWIVPVDDPGWLLEALAVPAAVDGPGQLLLDSGVGVG
jgi:hypothetical protein